MERDALKDTSRVVVKFGTGILTNRSKQIDPARLSNWSAKWPLNAKLAGR